MAEIKKVTINKRPKTGGRKAGVPNRMNREAKKALSDILQGNADKVQEMFDLIVDPKDFILLYLKLAEFCIPKMSSVAVSTDIRQSDLKSELEELAGK